MAPLTVFLTDEGLNGLAMHVVNDTPNNFDGELELCLYKHGETCVSRARQSIALAAHSSMMLRADAVLPHFSDTTYAYRFGPAGHHLAALHLYATDAEIPLCSDYHFTNGQDLTTERDLGLCGELNQVTDGHFLLTLQTQRVAQAIHINAPGMTTDDNYFHLSPGIKKVIRLSAQQLPITPKVTAQGLNMQSSVKCQIHLNTDPSAG